MNFNLFKKAYNLAFINFLQELKKILFIIAYKKVSKGFPFNTYIPFISNDYTLNPFTHIFPNWKASPDHLLTFDFDFLNISNFKNI